ncbi:succinate dehydrogenase subunit 7b [Quercus suber]|uniref:Succinate dehydrogenase subunit 7b n=1 Tax=Quercus suber TaxID=58331 RepID=A0AAW0JMG1_QUESU
MAFLLNKTSIASHFRSHSQNTVDALSHTRRAYHIELGAREKALLAEDPALKRFKSHKKSVNAVKRMGDVLTLVVVAEYMVDMKSNAKWTYWNKSCCYEIYVKAVMREEARKKAGTAGGSA